MRGWKYLAWVLLVEIVGAVTSVEGQVGAPVGAGGGIPGTSFGGITDPTNVQLQKGWLIVPAITASERYDSNVFFIPETQAPGAELADYVTTVSPQVRVVHGGSLMKGTATVEAVGEYYVVNRELNYVGANAGLSLDLSPALGRVLRDATLLVTDTFTYTPQPMAFSAGNLNADTSNPFLRGIQVGRIFVTSNVAAITGSVPLSPRLSVQSSYSNGFLRFGTSEVQQGGILFDTEFQTITAGLQLAVSRVDSLTVSYTDSKTQFIPSEFGFFSSRGGVIAWTHAVSPTVELKTSAGASLVEGTFIGSQPIPPTIAPTGSASLIWKGRDTNVTFSYSVMVGPSFMFSNEPLLSHVVSIAATHVLGPDLSLFAGGDYGRSDALGSTTTPLSFTSYGGTTGLSYRITPTTFASATYSYSYYNQQFGDLPWVFDRHVMLLSVAKAWR